MCKPCVNYLCPAWPGVRLTHFLLCVDAARSYSQSVLLNLSTAVAIRPGPTSSTAWLRERIQVQVFSLPIAAL